MSARLVFFGTGPFALPALRALAPMVSLVVTQPDRPGGRGMRPRPSPAKLVAEALGIPVATPERSRAPEFVERLRSEAPDALVVASYGQILSQAVLDSARRGGINIHASLLPKYRGAAPIQRCLLAGDAETGVTLMQMDRGMDTGDVIDVARTAVGADETSGELQDRLAEIAADLVLRWIARIVAGEYPRTPQGDAAASLAPKVEKAEAELRVQRPAKAEYDRFRAFTPAPGAFLSTPAGALLVRAARLAPGGDEPPGTVLAVRPELRLAFAGGALDLQEVQPEGKRRMSGRDFAAGARLRPGARYL